MTVQMTAEQTLQREIDELVAELRCPHKVVEHLKMSPDHDVETDGFAWTRVRRGKTTIYYPFAL